MMVKHFADQSVKYKLAESAVSVSAESFCLAKDQLVRNWMVMKRMGASLIHK